MVEHSVAVLREVDAEPAQGLDEGAELPLQPLGVARQVVGEVVDRGADDDREPEQHSDHREDDREESDSAGNPARLEPEDERCADDRDEDREQEGIDECRGGLEPRHHDDERGRREEDGLDPQMVLRGVHRAERCRSRTRDATRAISRWREVKPLSHWERGLGSKGRRNIGPTGGKIPRPRPLPRPLSPGPSPGGRGEKAGNPPLPPSPPRTA